MATPSTVNTWNLNGTQVEFDVTFDYLSRTFIVVTLLGPGGVQVLAQNTDYTFVTDRIIRTVLPYGPPTWDQIEIRRATSTTERLVEFQDASILLASDLNIADIQVMHVAEEARNAATETIGVNNDGNLDARGRKIVNLAAGSDDGDAMNLGQYRADVQSAINQVNRAETEANRARDEANRSDTRANASNASANASASSATLAQGWAQTPYNTVVPTMPAGSFSALHYSVVAANEASTATAQRLLASQWAQHPENVSIPGQPAGSYSSLHYSLKATAQAAAAAASAGAASTSAGNAATSVTQAATQVVLAQNQVTLATAEVTKARNWAIKTDGPVESGEFSAKYWAQQSALITIPTGSVGASKQPINDRYNMVPDSEFYDANAWFAGAGGWTGLSGDTNTQSYRRRRFVAASSTVGEVTAGTPNEFYTDSYGLHMPVTPGRQYDLGSSVFVEAGGEGILQMGLLLIGVDNANLGQAVIGANVNIATAGLQERRNLWTCPANVVAVRFRYRMQLSTTGTFKGAFSVFRPFMRTATEAAELASDVNTWFSTLEARAFQPKSVVLPSGTNANDIKVSGQYDVTGVVGGPPGFASSVWWYVEVQAHSNNPTGYVHQRWTRLEGGENDQQVYDRLCTNGSWQRYRRVMMDGDLGSVYQNFNPRAVDPNNSATQWIMHRRDGIVRLGGALLLPNNTPISVNFIQSMNIVMSAGIVANGQRGASGEPNTVITALTTSYIQFYSGQSISPMVHLWWVEGYITPP